MISGIRLTEKIYNKAKAAGFYSAEVRYEDFNLFNPDVTGLPIKCITINGSLIDSIEGVLKAAETYETPYILIETKGLRGINHVKDVLIEKAELIKNSNAVIALENGYYTVDGDMRKRRSGLNDVSDYRELLKDLRESVNDNGKYGAALNVGYSMLFAEDILTKIKDLKDDLIFMHVNENDGIHDMQQLPYTYTVGRGILLTDWFDLIRGLHGIGFDGAIYMDLDGLFSTVPEKLTGTMLTMAHEILMRWDDSFRWHEIIPADKELITFGAGRMLSFYMKYYGDKKKPLFTADNNETLWGTKVFGVEVRSPEEILKIPEDKRFVMICMAAYREAGEQLDRMGVRVDGIFDDNYYLYEDKEHVKDWCPDKRDIGKRTLKDWYRYDKEGRVRVRRLQPRRIYSKSRDIWRKAKSVLRRIVKGV